MNAECVTGSKVQIMNETWRKSKTSGSAIPHDTFGPILHDPWVLLNVCQRNPLLRVIAKKLEQD